MKGNGKETFTQKRETSEKGRGRGRDKTRESHHREMVTWRDGK